MASLACEDSRMSMDNDLSNLSPCKPATSDKESASTTTTNNTLSLLSTKDHCLRDEETEALSGSDSIAKDSKPAEELKSASKPIGSLSWAVIVEQELGSDPNPIGEMKECKSDSKMSMDENSNSNISIRSNGSGRQIEIDILDSANVKKYEKLIRDDKIKSPFKRRLSGGGEDDEPGDGHALFEDTETSVDGVSQHKKSKTNENDHGKERFRCESSSSSGDGSSYSSRKPTQYEKDSAILERRQKQIDYGKNTLGYENYLQQVPREQRTNDHPKTPPKHIKYSRRAWDGVVKVWRKQLHCYDPDGKPEADD